MDVGGRSVTTFLYGILIGIGLGYLLIWLRNHRSRHKFLAVAEYWVYLPGEVLPPQDQVMKLVLQGNSPVGPQEGLLLSDIRLHIALVLRSKNPHVFRPDLFEDYIEPTADLLRLMADSQSMAKIRYLSEIPLTNDAHLQLLPYLAFAYAKLADGTAIYDVTAERLTTVAEFAERLKEDRNVRRPEFHLQTIWRHTDQGGRAETRGLMKKGHPELVTLDVHGDERLLVTGLLDEAGRSLWQSAEFPQELEVESYNDLFKLALAPPKNNRSEVRIHRIQNA